MERIEEMKRDCPMKDSVKLSSQEAKLLINLLKDEIDIAKKFSSISPGVTGMRISECRSLIRRIRRISKR